MAEPKTAMNLFRALVDARYHRKCFLAEFGCARITTRDVAGKTGMTGCESFMAEFEPKDA